MGDKRKQKRTTKKTNWENIRSWVGAVLCIAVIVAVATYVAKLVPSSSAYTPGPIDVKPADGIPATPNPTNITFSDPIQLTGNPNDPWEYDLVFGGSDSQEVARDIDENNIVFSRWQHQGEHFDIFVYNTLEQEITKINVIDSEPLNVTSVRIWKDVVVYEVGGNIFMNRVVQNNVPIAVTNDVVTECGKPNMMPDIHNGVIVWTHQPDCGISYGLYVKDVNRIGAAPQKITLGFSGEYNPRIFDNVIVWADYDKSHYPEKGKECNSSNPKGRKCSEIHICDLKNDYDPITLCSVYHPKFNDIRERSLTNDEVASNAKSPDIYGGRSGEIVWTDDVNYEWTYSNPDFTTSDIFLYDSNIGRVTETLVWKEGMTDGYSRPLVWDKFVSSWRGYPWSYFIYYINQGREYDISFIQPADHPVIIGGEGGNSSFNLVFSNSYDNLCLVVATIRK